MVAFHMEEIYRFEVRVLNKLAKRKFGVTLHFC